MVWTVDTDHVTVDTRLASLSCGTSGALALGHTHTYVYIYIYILSKAGSVATWAVKASKAAPELACHLLVKCAAASCDLQSQHAIGRAGLLISGHLSTELEEQVRTKTFLTGTFEPVAKMAVSISWGRFCGCPYDMNPTSWGPFGPLIVGNSH